MRRLLSLSILLLLAVALVSCSDSGKAEGPTIDTTQRSDSEGLPLFTGEDECVDGTGDVQGAPAETPPEVLAAADLVRAQVRETDDVLHVELETAGPATGDTLRLSVQKGRDLQDPDWFELRAVQTDGVWKVTLHRIPPVSPAGGAVTEQITELSNPVGVDGSTYTLDIRLADLPDLDSSPTWQYGARVGGETGYIDICSPFED